MKKISVSLEERHLDRLEEFKDREDIGSRSEALREILDRYESLRTECESLRTECDDLRTRLESREERINELEEQLARRSQIEEKVDVLAQRVEERKEPDPPFFVQWVQWWRDRPNE